MTNQTENLSTLGQRETGRISEARTQQLLTLDGIVGALAAMSCCVLPLALFTLGISGAWIASLTRLAPYQPYLIAATLACLGGGYWLVYRSATRPAPRVRPAPVRYRAGSSKPGWCSRQLWSSLRWPSITSRPSTAEDGKTT